MKIYSFKCFRAKYYKVQYVLPSLSTICTIEEPRCMSTESKLVSCIKKVSSASTFALSLVVKTPQAVDPCVSPLTNLTFLVTSI